MAWNFGSYGVYARRQPCDILCDTDKLSFACWVRLSSLQTADQGVISHRGTDGQASLRRTAAEGVWRYSVTIPGGAWVTKDSTGSVTAATLYRVCGSWQKNSASGIRLWVNGSEQGSASSTTSQTANYNPGVNTELFIGHRSATSNALYGDVEGVIWVADYLWTAADIAELTYTGLPWFQSWAGNPHVCWILDPGLMSRIPDVGSDAQHIEAGGISGTPTTVDWLGKYEPLWIGTGGGGPGRDDVGGAVADPDWTEFGSGVSAPETCQTITGLSNGTAYQFKMRAEDPAGNLSADSLIVEATPNNYNIHVPKDVFLVAATTLRVTSVTSVPASAATALAPTAEKQLRLNCVGFEEGDPYCFSHNYTGNITGVWYPGCRSGRRGCRINMPATTTDHYLQIGKPDNTYGGEDDMLEAGMTCVRMWVKIEDGFSTLTAEAPFVRLEDNAGYPRFEICLRTDGKLHYYAGTGATGTRTALGAGSVTLEAGRWHELLWKAGRDTDNAYQAYVDGVEDISGTASFSARNSGLLLIGRDVRVGWSSAQALEVYYDDVVVAADGYPAPSKCTVALPLLNGNYTGWTPSTGTSKCLVVDDMPPNEDVDYIYSATISDAYTCRPQDANSAGIHGTIYSVKGKVVCRKVEDITTTKVATRLRIGGTDTDGTLSSLSTSQYYSFGQYHRINPTSGTQWTLADLSSIEFGLFKDAFTGTARCTAIYVLVEYSG